MLRITKAITILLTLCLTSFVWPEDLTKSKDAYTQWVDSNSQLKTPQRIGNRVDAIIERPEGVVTLATMSL